MTDKKDQREYTGQEADQSRDFAARRTVLKGIVSAVPVVLTVSAGEALANASNLQCVSNPPSLDPEQCIDANASDEYVRDLMEVPDGNGGTEQKNCLLYAYEDGQVVTTSDPGNNFPFTPSCYNSFT